MEHYYSLIKLNVFANLIVLNLLTLMVF